MAPLEDQNPVVWCHSRIDPRYAPPGKAQASHENFMPPATALTEREWLQLKKQHTEDMLSLWQTFAPNMTWDNVIGVAPDTPYDCCRLKNMGPEGNWNVLDPVPHQMGYLRPNEECSQNRTPVKNLYIGGASCYPGGLITFGPGYVAVNALAKDLGIEKWWPEPEIVAAARQNGML